MHNMRTIKTHKGFTAVEFLIYISLLGILSTAIYALFVQNFKTHSSQNNTMAMTQDLRAVMNLMVNEIRLASFDPTGVGGLGFVDDADDRYNTDGNSIHFTADITDTAGTGGPDGLTDGPNEDINYYLYSSGGIQGIGRKVGGAVNPEFIADNISALTFTYIFANGTTGVPDETDGDANNDLDDIRSVQVSVTGQTADIDPLTKQPKTKTFATTVKIRNLGL